LGNSPFVLHKRLTQKKESNINLFFCLHKSITNNTLYMFSLFLIYFYFPTQIYILYERHQKIH